jgi:hypothetical protein
MALLIRIDELRSLRRMQNHLSRAVNNVKLVSKRRHAEKKGSSSLLDNLENDTQMPSLDPNIERCKPFSLFVALERALYLINKRRQVLIKRRIILTLRNGGP